MPYIISRNYDVKPWFLFFSGKGPSQPAPKFIGHIIAFLLNLVSSSLEILGLFVAAESSFNLWQIGPKGLEFAKYSLDYHTIRNYLHVYRVWGKERYSSHWPKLEMNLELTGGRTPLSSRAFFWKQSQPAYAFLCQEDSGGIQCRWRCRHNFKARLIRLLSLSLAIIVWTVILLEFLYDWLSTVLIRMFSWIDLRENCGKLVSLGVFG